MPEIFFINLILLQILLVFVLTRWKSALKENWPCVFSDCCKISVPIPLHRIMKMAALKGHFSEVGGFFEDIQLAYTKTTSWSRTKEYLFIWRGTFKSLEIIHVLLCFSLYSYYSCHWWFHFLMWLRIKEEIWIDWIYNADTLIPVKFHNKVIAIGYWQPNFSWFLGNGKTSCCLAVMCSWVPLLFMNSSKYFSSGVGVPKLPENLL